MVLGTFTLVVIDEIVARSRLASGKRTVRNVDADVLAVCHISLETTVTVALVVVEMNARGVSLVYTLDVGTTSVTLTVVHIETPVMVRVDNLTDSLKWSQGETNFSIHSQREVYLRTLCA